MFTLAISYLTMSNLPWFMDLTFQDPMQYCFFTSSDFTFIPDRSITEHCFCFGPAASFFLDMKITQSCLSLCSPMAYTVHGILQARILEWVAVPFFRVSSQPRDQTQVSHIAGGFFSNWVTREAISNCPPLFPSSILDTFGLQGLNSGTISFYLSILFMGSSDKNTGVGCHSLLKWTIFCQNSSLQPVHLGWPYTAWFIVSLSYTRPFARRRLWSKKGFT